MPTPLFPLIVLLLTVSVPRSMMPNEFPLMVLLLIVNVLPWMPRGWLLLIVLSLIVAEPPFSKIPPIMFMQLCDTAQCPTAVFALMVLLLIVKGPKDAMAPPVALQKVPTRKHPATVT